MLAASADKAINGGITPNYAFKTLKLPNGGGQVSLSRVGLVIDAVTYKSNADGWPAMKSGRTLQLTSDKLSASANDSGANWCVADSKYGAGDYGTPGKANTCKP